MKKLTLLCLLSFLATTWAKAFLPSIDTSNGSLKLFYSDISIPARGLDLKITRGYWNQGKHSGYFGNKWTSNIDLTLIYYPEDSRKTIGFILKDGKLEKLSEEKKVNPAKIKVFEENITRKFEPKDGTETFVLIHHDYQIITRIPDGFY